MLVVSEYEKYRHDANALPVGNRYSHRIADTFLEPWSFSLESSADKSTPLRCNFVITPPPPPSFVPSRFLCAPALRAVSAINGSDFTTYFVTERRPGKP